MASPTWSFENALFVSSTASDSSELIRSSVDVSFGLRPLESMPPLDVDANSCHLAAYRIAAAPEQSRAPRVVRVAAIQNSIVLPTDAPIDEQRRAIHARVGRLIEMAAAAGAQIVCMQVKSCLLDMTSNLILRSVGLSHLPSAHASDCHGVNSPKTRPPVRRPNLCKHSLVNTTV